MWLWWLEQYNQEKLGGIDSKILEDVNRVIVFNNTNNALKLIDSWNPGEVTNQVDNVRVNNVNPTIDSQISNSVSSENSVNNQDFLILPLDSLKNLDGKQLANYIKKSFQNKDGTRFTYSHMKQNPYYPFMVQSAIDLLSDKLNDAKYDEEWKPDPANWRSLDDWLGDAGWINNSYWVETKDVVKIVQKVLGLTPVDWLAGPRFFANICAKLTDEQIQEDEFNVEWYNNKMYNHWHTESRGTNPDQELTKKTGQNSIPDNWNEWIDCTDKTKEFINDYGKYLAFSDWNKQQYVKLLASILNDFKKEHTLNSLMKLDHRFRWNFKLDYDKLKLFKDSVGSKKVDASRNTLVFKACSELNDDYLTYRNWVLVRQNEWGWQKHAFEADGSHRFDDYRFDSVEGLFAFFEGKKIVSAKKNVRNLEENEDFTHRNNRFANWVIDSNALLESIWNAWTKEWKKRRKTFISLLELPDRFWWDYKLTKNNIDQFVKWMEKNVFDWRSWSASVFHPEWSHWKFEVDGTWVISDKNFKTVQDFFSRLGWKVK